MSKFCTNMDSLILHETIALEDCIHLPRPNTSNIYYECTDKILEFMTIQMVIQIPLKIESSVPLSTFFSKCVFSNKIYPCARTIVFSYFANIQSHCATDISSINSLIFSGDKDFNNAA